MKTRRKITTQKERLEGALADIGGEPLEDSGFENEEPEEEFSGACVLPSTLLPLQPKTSH
jgi:hypothetical protein